MLRESERNGQNKLQNGIQEEIKEEEDNHRGERTISSLLCIRVAKDSMHGGH